MIEHKYVDDLIWIAKNRGDSISRQLSDIVQSQAKEIEQLKLNLRLVVLDNNSLRKELQRLSDIEQEPVLWVHIKTLDRTIRQGTSGAFWHKFPDGYGLSKEEFIPLYKQPTQASEK